MNLLLQFLLLLVEFGFLRTFSGNLCRDSLLLILLSRSDDRIRLLLSLQNVELPNQLFSADLNLKLNQDLLVLCVLIVLLLQSIIVCAKSCLVGFL